MKRFSVMPRRVAAGVAAAGVAAVVAVIGVASTTAAQTWWQADGASWTEAYIQESDGTILHADVLRPASQTPGSRIPVVLSIGPYFNHSGQEGVVGPAGGLGYDPTGQQFSGPSNRFQDFVDGTQLIKQGYAYVMVDLRGFGGSTGCLDWAGPGEQADVKAAVEWAASQPWSTGKVGMYGKSYDAVTGLIGEAQRPRGLAAIVAQEPVYDLYRYLYTNGVRFINSLETPALYDAIAATPEQATDSPQDIIDSENDTARPGCPVQNYLDQAANSDHNSAYWLPRNLITEARGHKIPIFMTQGFLENNTKPDGAWDFFNELRGPKKAWFGMWDHIRGNDVVESDNSAPHPWFDQIMRFYNHFVKGVPLSQAPTNADPSVAVETSDGTWRAEQQWPPLDSSGYTTKLLRGGYTDSFNAADSEDFNAGTSPSDTEGAGVWTISPPIAYPAHFAGVPGVTLDVTSQAPNSDLSVDVYDIHPDDKAILLSRTANLLAQGEQVIRPEMYGNDWLIGAGDRLGVVVTSANDGWWQPIPTQTPVTLNSGTITLPFLRYTRSASQNLTGYKYPQRLKDWLAGAGSLTLSASTVSGATDPGFQLPPPETQAPSGFNAGAFGLGTVPRRARASRAAVRHRVIFQPADSSRSKNRRA